MTDDGAGIVVFLGPTCPLTVARPLLPRATYLPPVQCGDVLQALRLRPRAIAIIDGVFCETAAVWHKEILFALERGVELWGAASMGALRAAELQRFGMRGFGRVFSLFAGGDLTDDDEVAVLFSQRGDQYVALSDALVNVRMTLGAAVGEDIVPSEWADRFIAEFKRLHYSERQFISLLEGRGTEDCRRLQAWVSRGGGIDVKRDDALGLLRQIGLESQDPVQWREATNHSLSLRRLNLRVMTSPLNFSQTCLPEEERLLQSWRARAGFRLLRRLAHLLAVSTGLHTKLASDEVTHDAMAAAPAESIAQGGAKEVVQDLRDAIVQLDRAIATRQAVANDVTWEVYYRACLVLEGWYARFKAECEADIDLWARAYPVEHRLCHLAARFWWFHDQCLADTGLGPSPERVSEFTVEFRREHGLSSPRATEAWMAAHDLDESSMLHLMTSECAYRYLVEGAFFEHFGFLEPAEDRNWLLEAVRIVDCS